VASPADVRRRRTRTGDLLRAHAWTLCQDVLDDGLLRGVVEPADVENYRTVLPFAIVYLVLAKRCTAARSSSLFVAATFSSPAVSASRTQ
jgi:hypothetical protein